MKINRIKFFRIARNFRQIDIARAMGISEGYVSKIETGRMKPSSELLSKIAAVLEIEPDELKEQGGAHE